METNKNVGGMCIVPGCSSAYYTGCGIRFHLFPKAINKRNKWLKCLNMKSSDYNEKAILCYLHFDSSDYCNNDPKSTLKSQALPNVNKKRRESNSGGNDFKSIDVAKTLVKLEVTSSSENVSIDNKLCLDSNENKNRIKNDKMKLETVTFVPKVAEEENETKFEEDPKTYQPEDIENVLTHVCKTCLATGCKMYPMKQYNLEQSYLLLSGIDSDMFNEGKMPQMICFECLQRFQNLIQFSTKIITAWSLLKELSEGNKLSMENIKKINRKQNLLTSRLNFTNFEPNHFDIQIEEYEDAVVKIEDLNESMDGVLDIDHVDIKQNSDIGEFEIEIDVEMNTGSNREEVKNKEMKYEEDIVDKNSENDPNAKELSNSDKSVQKSKVTKKNSEKYNKKFNEMFVVRIMTPEEQKTELEERKKTSNYQNAAYKCHECYRSFNREEPYNEHMKAHTDEHGKFVCDICRIHFMTRISLTKHIRGKHVKVIQCKLCQFKTVWKTGAIRHKRFHEGSTYKCQECSKTFAGQSSYRYHIQRWHPEDAVCHLCGQSFAGIRSLVEKHLRVTHRGEDLLIPPTKSRFQYSKKSLKRTKNYLENTIISFETTLPDTSPHCSTCDIRFRDENALNVHETTSPSHGNSPKPPLKPTKPPRRAKKAQRRKKKDSGPIACEQCGVVSPGVREYIRHFKDVHPGLNRTQYSQARPTYMCELCGRIFQNITVLNEHRQSHNGERPYACQKCDATFKMKNGLTLHMINHTKSRRCTHCGKMYATVCGLMRHLLIHTGKPYSCESCNKRFCTPSAKRAHVQHHHLGVPWPKRSKDQPRTRTRGGKFTSEADMANEENVPHSASNVVTPQYLEE